MRCRAVAQLPARITRADGSAMPGMLMLSRTGVSSPRRVRPPGAQLLPWLGCGFFLAWLRAPVLMTTNGCAQPLDRLGRSGKRVRWMHDMLPQPQADANDAPLTDANPTTAQWQAALRVVKSEFPWQLEKITLSRTGLADVVELIARSDHTMSAMSAGDVAALWGEAPKANGHPALGHVILGHVLGSTDRSRALAARASRAAGWRGEIGMAV